VHFHHDTMGEGAAIDIMPGLSSASPCLTACQELIIGSDLPPESANQRELPDAAQDKVCMHPPMHLRAQSPEGLPWRYHPNNETAASNLVEHDVKTGSGRSMTKRSFDSKRDNHLP
jgi:hypothetical protein